MPNAELPIIVVDDIRFSNRVITRILQTAGYDDIRSASSALHALRMIDERPARILIADWIMPEMDGLELVDDVRRSDKRDNRYTYIIMLTAKDSHKDFVHAFDRGVDDFVNKAEMTHQLLARVYAADRLTTIQNRVLQDHQVLRDANQDLIKYHSVDPLTGLGNQRYVLKRLQEQLDYLSARGGRCVYIGIKVHQLANLSAPAQRRSANELMIGISRRLRQLVRPTDVVARIAVDEFAILTPVTPEERLFNSATAFRRVLKTLNVKSYKTSAGHLHANTGLSVCELDNHIDELVGANDVLSLIKKHSEKQHDSGITLCSLPQTENSALPAL